MVSNRPGTNFSLREEHHFPRDTVSFIVSQKTLIFTLHRRKAGKSEHPQIMIRKKTAKAVRTIMIIWPAVSAFLAS
jgi:hypothetical protein